jgi:hypothetical protein
VAGWTKLQIIEQAFEEIGLAGYTYDLQPELVVSAGRRLDAMILEWDSAGIRTGYQLGGDLSEQSGIELRDISAVYLELAIRLSPSLGKSVDTLLAGRAQSAYTTALIRRVQPGPALIRDGMPLGAGNGTGDQFHNNTPQEPLTVAGDNDKLEFLRF